MGVKWLKQSTAATARMGPFVDKSDGYTAETSVTIDTTQIRLSKDGGDFVSRNSTTGSKAHDEFGYYNIALDATDTNTLGRLRIGIRTTVALPVWEDFMVVPENVWDSMFGSDYLRVDIAEVTTSGLAQITTGVRDDIVVEKTGTYTLKDAMSIMLSVLAGRTTDAGAKFLTPDGTAARVTATVNSSNERTSMTLDPSS